MFTLSEDLSGENSVTAVGEENTYLSALIVSAHVRRYSFHIEWPGTYLLIFPRVQSSELYLDRWPQWRTVKVAPKVRLCACVNTAKSGVPEVIWGICKTILSHTFSLSNHLLPTTKIPLIPLQSACSGNINLPNSQAPEWFRSLNAPFHARILIHSLDRSRPKDPPH